MKLVATAEGPSRPELNRQLTHFQSGDKEYLTLRLKEVITVDGSNLMSYPLFLIKGTSVRTGGSNALSASLMENCPIGNTDDVLILVTDGQSTKWLIYKASLDEVGNMLHKHGAIKALLQQQV